MSRPSRRRRHSALLRGRFRTLFFLGLAVAALALGHRASASLALIGVLAGVASIRVARVRAQELSHSFAVLDWLFLGCVLALSGGTASWLLAAVPLLAMGQLAAAPRAEWPFLVAPSVVLVIVLAIADPSLGGNRAAGLLELTVLVAGGVVAAGRLRRAPARPRAAAKVDDATGFYTGARLDELLAAGMRTSLEQHQPLTVACLRLEHFEDARNFLGPSGSEQLVAGVARRLERHLCRDGVAFRLRPDVLVALLPGDTLAEARERMAAVEHDVTGNLIAGRRQTLAVGAASFPTIRDRRQLLAAALGAPPAAPAAAEAPPQALPLAAAR